MCYPACEMMLIEIEAHVAAGGFLSHYRSGPLQYV